MKRKAQFDASIAATLRAYQPATPVDLTEIASRPFSGRFADGRAPEWANLPVRSIKKCRGDTRPAKCGSKKKGPRKGRVPGGQRTPSVSGSDWTLVELCARNPVSARSAIAAKRLPRIARRAAPTSINPPPLYSKPADASLPPTALRRAAGNRKQLPGAGPSTVWRTLVFRAAPAGRSTRPVTHVVAGEYGNRRNRSRSVFRQISRRI